ncbi:M20/M25/M40 family metallo-hydrolase [Geomicrobium sp. JCM 19037]|uniref:M20/M25/M40 family metallo-hydrolase n=1 Tax=Geomicrobium sp. JCM 19037 TaxID=1460634 RepID=UPI002100CE80|nr:M20/M25/M40 family metallo-hydrolase [Geomicrobium sp. JCM 19037]
MIGEKESTKASLFWKENIMHINRNRLLETIATSASIGRGENGGIQRLALTAEDQQMRNQLKMWMEEEQLNVRIDDFGNMYGRRKGRDNHPAILIGSHLDTQPHGGKYDGIIGVLGALEVIRTLNEHGVVTNTPIEIVNFTNEEGARFAPPLLGSSGLTANSNKERIYQIRDRNGTTFHDALAEIGYIGDEKIE